MNYFTTGTEVKATYQRPLLLGTNQVVFVVLVFEETGRSRENLAVCPHDRMLSHVLARGPELRQLW